MALEFPWKPVLLEGDDLRRVVAAFPDYSEGGMARWGPSGYLAVPDSGPFFKQYYNTPLHPDDVWIVTLPKCGTTWTQELIWLLKNDCDFEGAKSLLMPDRWHFLEIAGITAPCVRDKLRVDSEPITKRIMFDAIESRPTPWFVKTHHPLHMLPPKLLDTCKVVYVARNPKDMCISYFHHLHLYNEAHKDLTLETFFDLFIESKVSQLPYFSHVLEAWRQRDNPNLLFLFFEDLKKDLRGCILRVAKFLGKSPSEEQVNQLEEHLHFKNFKNNPWVNWEWLTKSQWSCQDASMKFMRKGQTGDWKNHFTAEMDAKMNAWMKKEMKGTDLTFVLDIPEGK